MTEIRTIPALRRLIAQQQSYGLTLRAALRVYRDGGGKVRTEDFATLWRDEQRKRNGSGATS